MWLILNKLRPDELQSVVVALCDIFKCAVCAEVLQPDTLSCVQGHCICTKCKGKRETCPSCRSSFSNMEQNTIVSRVLEVIPHPCRYKRCLYIVTSEDDHESYCGFRPSQCRHCQWNGPASELTSHFKEDHQEKVVFLEKTQPIITHCEDFKKRVNVISQFSVYGHFLWLVEDLDPSIGVLRFTFIPVFCGKPNHDIYVKVSFKAEQKEYRVSTRIRMESRVVPEEENCMLIPISILHNFYNEETRELGYSVYMFKSKRHNTTS